MMQYPTHGRRPPHRRGTVLLFVLVVLLLVSSVSLAVVQSLRRQAQMFRRAESELQVRNLADAAESRARRLYDLDQDYGGERWQVDVRKLWRTAEVGGPVTRFPEGEWNSVAERNPPAAVGQATIRIDRQNRQLSLTAEFPLDAEGHATTRRTRPLDPRPPDNSPQN